MTPLSYDVGKTILAFTPEVTHAQVSKAFAAWTKKAQELEWRVLGSNPLLEKQVAAITDPLPLCFKKLLNTQREAFLTSTFYDAFIAAQPAFAGSYGRARFAIGAMYLFQDALEQDDNLEEAWRPEAGQEGIARALGLNDYAPDFPKTAGEIRAYLDNPANLATINLVQQFDMYERGLTGIPLEIARFPMLQELYLDRNQIRCVPKEIYNLKHLDTVSFSANRFECIPKMPLVNSFIDLRSNPIKTFPEDVYDYYFTYENWLCKPFSDPTSIFSWFGCGYLFGYVGRSDMDYINVVGVDKKGLEEIPFALWLREKLYMINPVSLLSPEEHLSCLPEFLQNAAGVTCVVIAILIAPFLWLLNEFLSLVVVPVVTKVRELLGYGRMIKLV